MDNRAYELQRLKYWQGQKLLSRDFRDQTSYEAQLRWWHNRALHNAYGVSYGFAARLSETRVRIDCGVAYDCYGRELILQTPREVELPEAGTDFVSVTLVASYDWGDSSISSKELLMGETGCSSRGMAPLLQWQPSKTFNFTDGVALAEITYEPSAHLDSLPASVRIPVILSQRIFFDSDRKLLIAINGLTVDEAAELKELSDDATYLAAIDKLATGDELSPVLDARFIVRRARGFTRPRIGSGQTVPGDTAWELWTETTITPNGPKVEADLGVQVTIDTSGVGFTEVPCYFAWVEGTLWNQVHLNFFPVPLIHIDKETTSRFRLRLWMPSIITLLGGRIRYANITPNLQEKGPPPQQTLLLSNVAAPRTEAAILDRPPAVPAAAAVAATVPPDPPTYIESGSFVTDFINFARQQKLYVCWTGIQETVKPQCEPFPSCECLTTIPEPPPPKPPKKPPRRRRLALQVNHSRDLILKFLKIEGKP